MTIKAKHSNLKYIKTKKNQKQKQISNFVNWFNWQYLKKQNYNKYNRIKQTFLVKTRFLQNLLFFYTNYKLSSFYNKKTKKLKNNKIVNTFQKFELRLDVVISKTINVDLKTVNCFITNGLVYVNRLIQHSKYICQINDILQVNYCFLIQKYNKFHIGQFKRKNYYLKNKKVYNYLELDIKTQAMIILRVPFFFEIVASKFTILKKNFVKVLHLQLKLIYNLY